MPGQDFTGRVPCSCAGRAWQRLRRDRRAWPARPWAAGQGRRRHAYAPERRSAFPSWPVRGPNIWRDYRLRELRRLRILREPPRAVRSRGGPLLPAATAGLRVRMEVRAHWGLDEQVVARRPGRSRAVGVGHVSLAVAFTAPCPPPPQRAPVLSTVQGRAQAARGCETAENGVRQQALSSESFPRSAYLFAGCERRAHDPRTSLTRRGSQVRVL